MRKQQRPWILMPIAMFVSACATPAYNYQPVATEMNQPALETLSTARVGDQMLIQGTFEELDAIHLSHPVDFSMNSYTFSTGDYVKSGQNSDGEFFAPLVGAGGGHVQKGLLSDPFQIALLEPDGRTLCAVTIFNVKTCLPNVDVQRKKVPSLTANSCQQTLLYSGKVGDKIDVAYREFSSAMARPAFNNDVEYDLTQSKKIGYKDAEIEVIEATNEHIKYIVHRNFTSAVC
jgi:hypothetical protein